MGSLVHVFELSSNAEKDIVKTRKWWCNANGLKKKEKEVVGSGWRMQEINELKKLSNRGSCAKCATDYSCQYRFGLQFGLASKMKSSCRFEISTKLFHNYISRKYKNNIYVQKINNKYGFYPF